MNRGVRIAIATAAGVLPAVVGIVLGASAGLGNGIAGIIGFAFGFAGVLLAHIIYLALGDD